MSSGTFDPGVCLRGFVDLLPSARCIVITFWLGLFLHTTYYRYLVIKTYTSTLRTFRYFIPSKLFPRYRYFICKAAEMNSSPTILSPLSWPSLVGEASKRS